MAERQEKDGRRQRSTRSRRRIIEAVFALLREGDMHPSAGAIATRADVGLRTVFRHFEDIDSIHREMTDEMLSDILPRLSAPLAATDWRDQIRELAERNSAIYEEIFPIKLSLGLRRFQSSYLAERYQRDVELLRSGLHELLPAEIKADRARAAALELCLSFEAWRRLRQDQDLSVSDALNTLSTLLNPLLNDE